MDKDIQAGAAIASVVGTQIGAAGTQSRSEDEESTGIKDIKRTATQAFFGGGGVVPKRRSSSRSIKRKKFDDELVESSLAKSSCRAKGPPVIEPIHCSGSEPSFNEKKKVSKSSTTLMLPLTMMISPPSIAKRVKKSKQPLQITKDLGRWKPTDDLLLINAVLQNLAVRLQPASQLQTKCHHASPGPPHLTSSPAESSGGGLQGPPMAAPLPSSVKSVD